MINKKLLLLLLVIILPTFSTLLRPGYFPMHDDMQAMRLLQLDKCMKDGQIPCRWVPDMGYGYGYPQFNYYPPLPYYAMEMFHLAGLGFLDSVKAGFVLSVLLSAIGMYLLGRSLWGQFGGFLSSVFYVYAPYRAVDMYVRGAVGEFWALAFLPFIFWSARQVVHGQKRATLWLALSLTGLFTSHNITTLIFAPVFAAWLGFLYLTNKRTKEALLSSLWGFSLSAFFLLPAFFEQKFAHVETLLQGYFNYLAHFVSLKQLLFSNFWGYGSSELGPYDGMSLTVGILHWTLPFLLLGLLVVLRKKKEAVLVAFFVAVGWLALFFTHQKSVGIWNNIPILAYLQFPWRFLPIATFAFSAAVGSAAVVFPKDYKFKPIVASFLVAILLLFNAGYFKPQKWLAIGDSEKFSGEAWEKQITISIFDYLPIYAQYPPAEKAPEEPTVINGKAEILSGEKGTNWQKWKVRAEEELVLRLQLYDFPGWAVWLNGEKLPTDHNNELGLITISVPSGEHNITARLEDTPVRRAGNLVTLISLAAIPVFLRRRK